MNYNEAITVEGKEFLLIWLRDNCLCPACRHSSSYQKMFDYSSLPTSATVKEANFNGKELIVHWQEDLPHESRYPIEWLREHHHETETPDTYDKKVLWNTHEIIHRSLKKHDILTCDPSSGLWCEDLLTYGFAFFKNVDLEKLEDFMTGIGPIHPTEYGKFASIRSTPGAFDISETGLALSAHTDYSTYMHVAPLLQFMYFVENKSKGGESILVDGYRAAEDFRQKHPTFFDCLVKTPVEFQQRYTNWKYHYVRKRPVIELDEKNRVHGIFFGHSHAFEWKIPFAEQALFYEAYAEFFRYLQSPEYVYSFRLNEGECVVVQNARVLHGRKAFDADSGARHLITGYVPWEYLEARLRFNGKRAWYSGS